MLKSKKVLAAVVAGVLGCTILSASVFASSYKSTLSKKSNSTYIGATRSYDGDDYSIKITPKSFTGGSTSSYCRVSVCSTGIMIGGSYVSSETLAGPVTLDLPGVNIQSYAYIGTAGKGKRAYSFKTTSSSNPNGTAGFDSDVVYMYN